VLTVSTTGAKEGPKFLVWATLFPGVSPRGDPPSRANRPAAKAPVLFFAKNLVLFVGVSKDTMASVRAKRKTRQKLRFRRRGAVQCR